MKNCILSKFIMIITDCLNFMLIRLPLFLLGSRADHRIERHGTQSHHTMDGVKSSTVNVCLEVLDHPVVDNGDVNGLWQH